MTDFKDESDPYVRIIDLGSDYYIICIINIGYNAIVRDTRDNYLKSIKSV